MSTNLYGIRVLAVEQSQRRVRLRVFVVYQTQPGDFGHTPLPEDRSFFLRALTNVRTSWRDKSGHSPLDRDVPELRRFDDDWVDSNVWQYIERYACLAVRNDPLPNPPDMGVARCVAERSDGWEDEDGLTQADYDVWLMQERYLDHLVAGKTWGTPAYPTVSDELVADEADALPDLRLPRLLRPFRGNGCPKQIAVSSDGRFLAAMSRTGRIVAWETEDWGEIFRTGSEREPFQFYLHFLPTSAVLASHRGTAASVRCFDLSRGGAKVAAQWPFPDSNHHFTSPPDGAMYARSGKPLHLLDEDGGTIRIFDSPWCNPITFSADGRFVTAGNSHGEEHRVRVWRTDDGSEVGNSPEVRRVTSLALSPNGRFVAIANNYEAETIRRVSDGALVRIGKPCGYGKHIPEHIVWSPDGRFVATCMGPWSRRGAGHVLVFECGARWEESDGATIMLPR